MIVHLDSKGSGFDFGTLNWEIPERLEKSISASCQYQKPQFRELVHDTLALAIERLLRLLIASGMGPADIAKKNLQQYHTAIEFILERSLADLESRKKKGDTYGHARN